MMIRLILDKAADECVQECMKLTKTKNVGDLIAKALATFRELHKTQALLEELASKMGDVVAVPVVISVKEEL